MRSSGSFAFGFGEDDPTLHVRVYLADIPVRPGLYCASIWRRSRETLREGVGEGLPRIQSLREEGSGRTSCEHGVLSSALIDPPDCGSRLDAKLSRLEVEIADRHRRRLFALCLDVGRDHHQCNRQKGN